MAKKESYREEMEARLRKWKGMIDELGEKAEKVSKEPRSAFKRQLADFREQFEKVESGLEDYKEAGSEAWQTLKIGLEKAAGDLKESFEALMGEKEIAMMTEKKTKKTKMMGKRNIEKPGKKTPIKKQYLKTKSVCRVTFRLPAGAAPEAQHVFIVGDFNNWNLHATPMKKLQNGSFTVTLDLEPGREYKFRYLIDDVTWENDWNADKYVKSPFGDSDNSVVVV